MGCASQTARNAIRAFNEHGLDALIEGSTAPKHLSRVFDGQDAEDLKALLHRSPRDLGKDTSVWTLDLAAQVSFERGLVPERVSRETVRQALKRLGVGWKRAKKWITSPDPEYARKKAARPADRTGTEPSGVGAWLRRRDLVEPLRAAELVLLG